MPTRPAISSSKRPSALRSWFIIAAALFACWSSTAQAGPTGLLNDTGQTLCDNGYNTLVTCTVDNSGDAAVYKGQDGRFGRDPAALGTATKVGGGVGGFDFTRVCFNGDLQGAGACIVSLIANTTGTPTDTASADWACTKDNVTNLIWSLQIQTATWTEAKVNTYPNAGHNSANRCGFNTGWRLPTRRELLSIVHHGGLDVSYFPLTISYQYWTSDTYAPDPSQAWTIYFPIGFTNTILKINPQDVRLVRSGD